MQRLLSLFCGIFAQSAAVLNASHERCEVPLAGTNLVVGPCVSDVCTVQEEISASIPPMEQRQRITVEAADSCPSGFDGSITLGVTLSLGHQDAWYDVSREQRECLQIFAWLVNRRGGLFVGGERLAVHLTFVDDGSSLTQVTGALAHASRAAPGAHFLLGPYGSSLTKYATKQALAEGKLLVSPTASTPSVIGENSLTFGVLPPAHKEVQAAGRAVLAAASHCDRTVGVSASHPCSEVQRQERCARPGGTVGSCSDALLAGFVYLDAIFTATMCTSAPATFDSLGVRYALDASGAPLSQKVGAEPASTMDVRYPAYVEELKAALRPLQQANVTFIVGCTYYMSGRALIDALAALAYSPLAVLLSSSLSDRRYSASIAAGWWQGEYVLESTAWERSEASVRGSFSNLTGTEFSALFTSHVPGASVGYLGAGAFASAVVLASAIEAAGTLETEAVRQALVATDLTEFYTHRIRFDANGQNTADMVVSQMFSGTSASNHEDELVYVHGSSDAALADGSRVFFPQPTWAQRLCVRASNRASFAPNSSGAASASMLQLQECHGRGYCSLRGACVCDAGYTGVHCERLRPPDEPSTCNFPPADEYHFPEAKCIHASERCPVRCSA